MIVRTQLAEKEFIDMSFVLFYQRTAIKIVTILAAFFLVVILLGLVFFPQSVRVTNLLFPVLFCVFVPLSVYTSARKGYRSNAQSREKAVYDISAEWLFVEGETYTIVFQWKDIYEVKQTKNWLLIWQNKQRAMPIKMNDLWAGQIADIKEILDAYRVKNNLTYMSS